LTLNGATSTPMKKEGLLNINITVIFDDLMTKKTNKKGKNQARIERKGDHDTMRQVERKGLYGEAYIP
jgi:hypothetical protein